MALKIHTGIDLGSDTVKIAFAYSREGAEITGKFTDDPASLTAVPAVAYYDSEEKKWLYGDEVDGVGDKSFVTVVKIKYLLSLLLKRGARVTASNRDYYFNQKQFPKFYFPDRRKSDDFSYLCNNDMTFTDGKCTPANVCENFFCYLRALIVRRAEALCTGIGERRFTIVPSVIYPQRAGTPYIEELKRLTAFAFGTEPDYCLSMTKSLCAFAMKKKLIRRGESVLIFDIGEEDISVLKASLLPSGLAVDGVDGHSEPLSLGGKDIDAAVAQSVEQGMCDRETMGRPSSGEEGHIAETPLNSRQYLFHKDLKTAKIIIGMKKGARSAFVEGVPVCVSRDLYIQRTITKSQFLTSIGVSGDGGVAKKILGYIDNEIKQPVNAGVKKIFLTGGPVETLGLVKYLSGKLAVSGIQVLTFEGGFENSLGRGFDVEEYEDALYAPALGCALTSLGKIEIKTVIALSYGIRLYINNKPFLELLVNRGDELPPEGAKFFTPSPRDPVGISSTANSERSAPMSIMSTVLTQGDIDNRKYADKLEYITGNYGRAYLKVDPDNSRLMKKLNEVIGLKKVSTGDLYGDDSGFLYYRYNGVRVGLDKSVFVIIGVKLDGDGRAVSFAENDTKRNAGSIVTVTYLAPVKSGGRILRARGETERVLAQDIRFDFNLGEVEMV